MNDLKMCPYIIVRWLYWQSCYETLFVRHAFISASCLDTAKMNLGQSVHQLPCGYKRLRYMKRWCVSIAPIHKIVHNGRSTHRFHVWIQKLTPFGKVVHLKRAFRCVRDDVTPPAPPVCGGTKLLRIHNTVNCNVKQSVHQLSVGYEKARSIGKYSASFCSPSTSLCNHSVTSFRTRIQHSMSITGYFFSRRIWCDLLNSLRLIFLHCLTLFLADQGNIVGFFGIYRR